MRFPYDIDASERYKIEHSLSLIPEAVGAKWHNKLHHFFLVGKKNPTKPKVYSSYLLYLHNKKDHLFVVVIWFGKSKTKMSLKAYWIF